jgi:plastocyanin
MIIPVRALRSCATVLYVISAFSDPGAWAGSQGRPETHLITIENMVYIPAQLEVRPGDWVVFSNKDLFPHTVTADGKAFESNGIAANSTWKYRAASPGVYSYHCTFHPTMQGKLTVR